MTEHEIAEAVIARIAPRLDKPKDAAIASLSPLPAAVGVELRVGRADLPFSTDAAGNAVCPYCHIATVRDHTDAELDYAADGIDTAIRVKHQGRPFAVAEIGASRRPDGIEITLRLN